MEGPGSTARCFREYGQDGAAQQFRPRRLRWMRATTPSQRWNAQEGCLREKEEEPGEEVEKLDGPGEVGEPGDKDPPGGTGG